MAEYSLNFWESAYEMHKASIEFNFPGVTVVQTGSKPREIIAKLVGPQDQIDRFAAQNMR